MSKDHKTFFDIRPERRRAAERALLTSVRLFRRNGEGLEDFVKRAVHYWTNTDEVDRQYIMDLSKGE